MSPRFFIHHGDFHDLFVYLDDSLTSCEPQQKMRVRLGLGACKIDLSHPLPQSQ